jgi:hypothetical protein
VIGSVKHKALRRYIEKGDRQGSRIVSQGSSALFPHWLRLKTWMNWERFRVGGCIP